MRALVTGSNRGIGREVARQLVADHGLEVIVTARSAEDARATAAGLGPSARGEALDVSDDAPVRALRGRIDALDVLVNCRRCAPRLRRHAARRGYRHGPPDNGDQHLRSGSPRCPTMGRRAASSATAG